MIYLFSLDTLTELSMINSLIYATALLLYNSFLPKSLVPLYRHLSYFVHVSLWIPLLADKLTLYVFFLTKYLKIRHPFSRITFNSSAWCDIFWYCNMKLIVFARFTRQDNQIIFFSLSMLVQITINGIVAR